MTDPIDPFQTPEGSEDLVAALVGEGKKYKDTQALAKSRIHADEHIARLEAELATEREKAKDGKSVAELLEALRAQDPPPNNGQPIVNEAEPPASFKPEDIEKITLATLEKTENARKVAANKAAAIQKMDEVWGADAGKKLNETAKSLGLSIEYLDQVAQQSPSAFFQLTGLNANRTAPSGTTVPTSTVRFGGDASQKRDAAFYRELRRSNPKLWYESKTQIQYQRDALAQGEEFFN